MSDLISRRALIAEYDRVHVGPPGGARKLMEDAPSVEPKKARWIKPTGMMPPEHAGHYECSNCGFWAMRDWLRLRVVLTDFCPGCGADMREESDETD